MSVITIVLAKSKVDASVLLKFQQILGRPLQDLKGACSGGLPIVEMEIFSGDYQIHAAKIRSVLKVISEENLAADFYEIPYGERYVDNPSLDVWKIDGGVVEGILAAADKEVEQQLDS
ncbi:hypothetical protein ACIPL1_19705 [Pseudomonas sp. NPDC090202]|uniref:hypothetical protein n=1 Tax=unclassified Pseudomonas TaxID=196821 RepID=UPI003830B76F